MPAADTPVRLRVWPKLGVLVALGVTMLVLLGGAFALGYWFRASDAEVLNNAGREIEVTAVAELRQPEIDPIIGTLGASNQAQVRAYLPAGSQRIVVTSAPLTSGATLQEGEKAIELSGRPVLGLRLSVPLYRDLSEGDTGEDVRSVNDALGRLDLRSGGASSKYDQRTSEGIKSLYSMADSSATDAGRILPMNEILRMTERSMSVLTSSTGGAVVSDGELVFAATSPATGTVLRADVLTADRLEVDMAAEVFVSGAADAVIGVISAIGDFSGPITNANGESLPAGHDIFIEFETPIEAKAAVSITVRVALEGEPQVAVPLTTIRSDESGTYVWRRSLEGEFERVEVAVASQAEGWVLLGIASDIAQGDVLRVSP